ncbi:MAG: helix-turn-helix transcriptional regulator [Aggregatilineales bacterium]
MSDYSSATFDLTLIEKQMLTLLTQGYDTKDIMLRLHISESYAYCIIRQLKCRFDTKTRSGIVACAIARGLVAVDGIRG